MVLLQHCFHSEQNCFLLEQTVSNVLQTFQTDCVESSTQSSLVIQKYCSIEYPVFYHNESMSAIRFHTTAKGKLTHLLYILLNLEPMGKEFKTVVFYVTGAFIFVEIYRGK